jgi:MFS family permease
MDSEVISEVAELGCALMYVPVPELSQRRRLLVLAIYYLSLLLVGMDVTIVNVALPSIRMDLQMSVSGLQWTIDAYVLILASLLMLGGSTADRIGRRRTFQTGLVLFIIDSLLYSLAPGLGWLISFRMVQPSAPRCSTRSRCSSSPTT